MAVYLDWNATTPLRPEARDAWLAAQERWPGNASSKHAFGQQAQHAWDQGLQRIAASLGCKAHEIVCTGSGTESLATAIRGFVDIRAAGGIVASRIDHSAVLRNAEAVWPGSDRIALVAVDRSGRIDEPALEAALGHEPQLVCLQAANNETGTVQDLPRLIALVREHSRARILVDACQLIGKAAIDLSSWEADAVALAGHKFGAPRGTGLLILRTGTVIEPLLHGGRQQDDRRSGTIDLASCQALAAALEAAEAEREEACRQQVVVLTDCFAMIQAELPEAVWIAQDAPRLANTLSLGHPGVAAEALVTRLDLAGFAVSVGSACMARRGEPSHVIAALGLPDELRTGVIRVSIGATTTAEDLRAFARRYVIEIRDMLGRCSDT